METEKKFIVIIEDTGKFLGIQNGETHTFDLHRGARIYADNDTADMLIKRNMARPAENDGLNQFMFTKGIE